MLEYIRGKLTEASPFKATVEINGLGYGVHIPLSNYSKLPQIGKEVILYLCLIIREDSHRLFGFLTKAEKELFEKLNDISGIGPKTALALIGHMDVSDLQLAVSRADINLISKVPGIGKKTAERLIIELRDKLKNLEPTSSTPMPHKGVASDAISALIHLGYNPLQAQKAIKATLLSFEKEPPLGELITTALRCM